MVVHLDDSVLVDMPEQVRFLALGVWIEQPLCLCDIATSRKRYALIVWKQHIVYAELFEPIFVDIFLNSIRVISRAPDSWRKYALREDAVLVKRIDKRLEPPRLACLHITGEYEQHRLRGLSCRGFLVEFYIDCEALSGSAFRPMRTRGRSARS